MIDLKNMPLDPGCYLFKDSSGTIIYVGKAKSLKKRVSSYFSKKDHDSKTIALVAHIADVEFFATGTEVEALLLENNLIRKHKPKYNIDLRDSQKFAYIVLTNEKFPRLLVCRDKAELGKYKKSFGPYVNAESRDELLKVLRASFKIRTCKTLPKKECLRYHLQLCSAPCINQISESEYNAEIEKAEKYLKGNVDEIVSSMKKEMKDFSAKLNYEKAKQLRDSIDALEVLNEKQRVEKNKVYDEDIINYIVSDDKVYVIVFNLIKGMLTTKKEFVFPLVSDFLDNFVSQYYLDNAIPRTIILPHDLADDSIVEYLNSLKKSKVEIVVPKKGDLLGLLEIVKKNIEIAFFAKSDMINSLRDELELNSNPNVIECFDISNISGTSAVASMVQFRDGAPDKSNYRRFKIKTVIGSDDFASIHEVVYRRYYRLKIENAEFPDLIVVDGGLGQLHAAIDALRKLGLHIPIISLAKKFEEVYVPGREKPIYMDRKAKGLKLLIQLRDEAHRFAINYHRLVRSKKMLED